MQGLHARATCKGYMQGLHARARGFVQRQKAAHKQSSTCILVLLLCLVLSFPSENGKGQK
jgi:hypothetical protein